MNLKTVSITIAIVALVALTGATARADVEVETITVELRGTATGVGRSIENLDGVMKDMVCFDVDLFKPGTDKVVGQGTDCFDFSDVVGDPLGGQGFTFSNTTFFHLKGGTIVSQNRTTVQPVIDDSSAGSGVTHITGDIPDPTLNNIISTTGKFRKAATGSVRLSGAADLSVMGDVTFSCIFVISLDMEDDD